MNILLAITAAITAASLVLAALVGGVVWFRRRRFPWQYLKWMGIAHVPLALLYFFVGAPATLAYLVVSRTQTRGDESDYSGPRIDADGVWRAQTRELSREERNDKITPGPELVGAARKRYVSIVTEDEVTIGGWHVPMKPGGRGPTVVCAHGWFRGGLEIDPVGAMFHELGCEVLLLELRGHGRSDARFTFGNRESNDVRAAVRWLRSRPGHEGDRVILFGVSIGAVAIALAAPSIDGLAGIVLDAPTESIAGVADRILAPDSGGHLRRQPMSFPKPASRVLLQFVQYFIGSRLEAIRPIDGVRALPADVYALVIGGSEDQRMPPDIVREVFDAVPAPADRKELWIREGSDHGHVWSDDPDGYRERLERLVARTTERAPANNPR